MVSYVGVPLERTLQAALWCWYCIKVAIADKYAQVTPPPQRNFNNDVIVPSTIDCIAELCFNTQLQCGVQDNITNIIGFMY